MLKYLVIITLIWAVTQTPSPVPEKALDSASPTAGSVQNQGKNDKGNPTLSDGSGWGLVVVGVLQTLLFTVTWIAIRQQATTQKTAERAWMIITPDKPEGWEPILLPEQPGVPATLNVFRAAIKNVGRTPAHVTKIAARKSAIKIRNWDGERFLTDYMAKLPARSLVYCDPPYFRKAERIYPNYYSPEDHARIARVIQAKVEKPWLISYDSCDEIMAHYSARKTFRYTLQYNAAKTYTGTELFIFSDKVRIPRHSCLPVIQAALTQVTS